MAYQTAKEAAAFLIRNAEQDGSTPSINFFGGEPLLCWDSIIVPLTKYIREEYRRPFSLSITSNGVLLDEEKLQFMKGYNIGLLFSIDGDKKTQDHNRPLSDGEGSFDRIAWLVKRVPELYPNAVFRSTIVPATCENVFHNIKFAHAHGWKSVFMMPNCFEEWDDTSRATLESEMRKFSDWCIQSFRDGLGFPVRFSEHERSFRSILQINSAIQSGEHRAESKCGSCAKCGLGTNRFAAINYKGELFGCQELASPNSGTADYFYIGNIYDGIDDGRRENLAASFDSKRIEGDDCNGCRLNHICNGGCVANNYMHSGDVCKVPPVWRWWERLLLEEGIYMMNTLGGEANAAFIQYWGRINGQ